MLAADTSSGPAASTGSRSARCSSCSAARWCCSSLGGADAAVAEGPVRLRSPWPSRSRRSSSCFVLWDDITDDGTKHARRRRRRVRRASRCGSPSRSAWRSLLVVAGHRRLPAPRGARTAPRSTRCTCSAAIGGVVMASANDLIVLFLGLEILSIALYVLAASHRRRIESQESGIKYFVLGGFSSAFFLYGIALLYGGAGSTNFTRSSTSFNATVSLDAQGRARPRRRRPAARRPGVQDRRRCRSTSGRPTCTRARRRRSPRSWPRPARPPRSRRCCACCRGRAAELARRLPPGDLGDRRADAASSARSWPSCRPT